MLPSIVFSDWLWEVIEYLPLALAILGGVLLGIGGFSTRGWQPTCRACRHDLRTINSEVCPECGANLRKRGAVRPGRRELRPILLLTALMCLGLTVAALPAVGYGPLWLRAVLADAVAHKDVVRRRCTHPNDMLAWDLHGRRMQLAQYQDAAVQELERHLAHGLFTESQPGGGDDMLFYVSRTPSMTDEIRRSMISLLAEQFNEGRVTAERALYLIQACIVNDDPAVLEELANAAPMVIAAAGIHAPGPVFAGDYFSLSLKSGVPILRERGFTMDVREIQWRRTGALEWQPFPDETSARHRRESRQSQFVMLKWEDPGSFELLVTCGMSFPSAAASDSVEFDRMIPIVVTTPEAVEVQHVRGGADRASIERRLSRTKVTRAESSGWIASFGPHELVDSKVQRQVHYCGAAAIGQDGVWHDYGDVTVQPVGGEIKGFLASDLIDATRPFTLRIVPNAEPLKSRMPEGFVFLHETAELDFPGWGRPPTAIRWSDPPEDADRAK